MDVASLQVIIKTQGVEAAQRELDKLGKNASNAEKSVGGLASSMQTLANIAIVGYLAKATKSAIELNAQFESMQIGIASLISVNAKNTTSMGKSVTSYEKFTMAQKEAAEAVELLRKANAETPATLKELTDGFQSAIGPALKYGMSISQTVNYTKLMTQAAAAMGMPMQQLAQEMRAILTGNIDMNAAVARNLGITNEQITLHKKQGDMYEFLISKLQDFEAAGKSMANSWAGITSNLEDTIDSIRKNASSGLFGTLKEDIKELNSYFISNASQIEKEVSSWLDTFYSLGVVMGSTSKNIVVLYQDVDKLSTVLGQNAKEDGNLGLFKNSILGLNILLDSMYVGLHNSIELASRLAVSSKNAFEFLTSGELEKAKNAFDDMLNPKGIISAEELLNRQIDMYKKLLNVKSEFSKESKKEEVANQKGNLVFGATAEKTEEELRKIKKLAEDWSKRNIEITTNMAIAQQDELSKPFIVLEAKYKEDLETFKGVKGAKERLTLEYNAEVERQLKDLTEKFNKEEEAKAKKSAEWQVKMLEANEKYNDEIIKMQDEMYGTDTTVEAWYNNQLEYLGKLSQEAGATAEELQTLLDKIETLKSMKLQKQTISFKVEQSFYSSFENNLADSIEDAFNGTLNFKKFFRNIGNDLMKTFSSSLASVGTNMLRGNYSALAALGGASASLVGTSISAGDISGIMNNGGTFDSATNTITTSGGTKIGLNESGGGSVSSTGSDIMSLVNTVGTLKTAYTLATAGLSTTVMNGFIGVSDALMSAGMYESAAGVANFGYGFANPWSYAAANPTGAAMAGGVASGALMGGAVGYGAGYLGDKLMGANTYASTTGAIGGAAAGGLYASGMISGPVGWAVLGASLLLGGLFGKKEVTDVGYQFFDNMTALDEITTDTVKQYSDWKKKSWFSSSKGTNYSNLSSKEMKQIESVFDTYDYLLTQLGETDRIFLSAGKYTGATFGDELSKNFISIFTDIPRQILSDVTTATNESIYEWSENYMQSVTTTTQQWVANAEFDEIYTAWTDYATSIDATVMEAFTTMIGGFIQAKRTFEIWSLGDSIEALAKKSEFATADLNQIKDTLGATGTTVESFLSDFDKAVKENFTPETITQWESLGSALMTATDASSAYTTALANFIKASNDFISNFDIWSANSSGNTIEGLKIKADYLQSSFIELEKSMGLSGITVDNFVSTYNKLAYKNGVINQEMVTDLQSLGTALMTATDAQEAYNTALEQQATALLVQNETVYQGILTSFNAISELNIEIADIQAEQALISKGITKDNLTALEAQKSGIQTIMDMATSMRDKLISASNVTSVYKSVLESARIDFSKGDYSSDNISRLGEVSELYSESLKKYALSEADYKLGVLSIANEIESITGKTTTLADVENEIERVTKSLEALEPTLESQLSALELQRDTYVFQTDRQIATLETLLGSSSPMVQMLQVAISSLGKGATTNIGGSTLVGSTLSNVADIYSKLGLNQYQTDTSGYEYWTNQVNSGAIASGSLGVSIGAAAVENGQVSREDFVKQLYTDGLGRTPTNEEVNYWANQSSTPTTELASLFDEIDPNFKAFSSGGYTGNIGIQDIAGVVHGQEYVVNAQTTKDLGLNGSGGAFADMVAELASLRKLMVKLVSDNTKQLSTQRAILGERVAI